MGKYEVNLAYYEIVWENKYANIHRHKISKGLHVDFDRQLYRDDLLVEFKKIHPDAKRLDGDWGDNHISIAADCTLVIGRFERGPKSVNIYLLNPLARRLKNTHNLPKMPEGNFGIERDLAQVAKSVNTRLIIASEPTRKEVAERLAKQDEAEDKLRAWETHLKQRFAKISCNYDSDRYKIRGTIEINGTKQEYETTGAVLDFQARLSLTPEQTEEFFTILNRWKRQNDERRQKAD